MRPATSSEDDIPPIVEILDVHKSFGPAEVLRGTTLIVRLGEVVVITGRSGSGKSTLLRCVDHLETIDSGRIIVNGHLMGFREHGGRVVKLSQREVVRQRREIGMVFQHFNLFPHMTVLDNIVAAPIGIRRMVAEQARAEALQLLARVGLEGKQNAYPGQLSGGQQQRVAIARALAMHPKVMLFDEPTSALDPAMTHEVIDVMTDLSRQGMTMLIVSHEMGFARAAADRIVLMHEGRVVEDAPPTVFFQNPKSEHTRQFLGNLLG
jgi:ABC-type polar amino acid transport system ATPase subunit